MIVRELAQQPEYCRIIVAKKSNIIMPTLSLTVLPAKALKDGRNKVRISIAHNSTTRYIVTDVVINSPREWKNGQIVKRDDAAYLNTKLRKKLDEVQRAIDDIQYIEGLSCAEIIEAVTSRKRQACHTLRSAFEEMMEVADTKPSTSKIYTYVFNSITRFIPETTKVASLSPLAVKRYIKARSDLSQSSLQLHVCLLGRILNYCQQNRYTDFRTLPTSRCIKQTTVVRQSWLTPDQVRFIRDYRSSEKWCERFRDLFMLTYYLGGINTADLCSINFNECSKTIKYVRKKTERTVKCNPFVEFDIPDEAKEIISRHISPNGQLDFFGHGYATSSTSLLARRFRGISGFKSLTMYSARKSFAQHAFQLGISESVIDYILGHSLNAGKKSTIYSYIKVTPAMATTAMRKVCDFIAGDGNFE